ncbi:MAG: alpha/beta fold hydrolase [Acidimicrobiales bacterium]
MIFPTPIEQRANAIVLVHGAWVGEWSWLPVLAKLQASGRPVHAVSLTGHGVRRHQGGPHVTLADHATDVSNYIETYDLTDITLVGHSYGGRVITQACGKIGDRVESLVFLDAHTPVAPDPGQPEERIRQAEANGGMLPFASSYTPNAQLFGGQAAVDWFLERTVDQSFACLNAPWLAELPPHARKTFVLAAADDPSRFAHYADAIRGDDAWSLYELDGPHFLMVSHPNEVTSIILDA